MSRSRDVPAPSPASRPRLGRRTTVSGRDESGLITLEWLLTVAAALVLSASIAFVAQDYVASAARNAGSGEWLPAAATAAGRVTADARAALPNTAAPGVVAALNETFGTKCDRLEIAYLDFAVSTSWTDADAADRAGIFNVPNPPARVLCTVATRP